MLNKKLFYFFVYALLIFYSTYNNCMMTPGKNTAALKGNYQQTFAPFNKTDRPEPITIEQIDDYLTQDEKNKITEEYMCSLPSEQVERINDYLTAEEKLNILAEQYINSLPHEKKTQLFSSHVEKINKRLTPDEKKRIADQCINPLPFEQKKELFSPYIEKVNNEQSAKAKEYYSNGYYNAWFEQLKKVTQDTDNSKEQEKLLALTIEAYQHLCKDKNVNITPEELWKTLTIKVRMEEKGLDAGQSHDRIQIKTPLTETFTIIKNKAEQIIKNDQDTAKKFRKNAQKQDKYNNTITTQVSWSDFAELGLILPFRSTQRAFVEDFADLSATNLSYYIDGNAQDKKIIIDLNNKTAKHLEEVNKLIPNKNKLNPEKEIHSVLEKLTKLKEKQNDNN